MPILQISTLPNRAVLWHDEALVTAGNALAAVADSAMFYWTRSNSNPPANGDAFTNSFWLRAGTYTFSVLGETGTDRGMIDWYLDSILSVSAQDWYANPGVANVIQSSTLTVIGDGYHVLKGIINGKNVSSSGYAIPLTNYSFKQSAD